MSLINGAKKTNDDDTLVQTRRGLLQIHESGGFSHY